MPDNDLYVQAMTFKESQQENHLPRLRIGIKKTEFIQLLESQPGEWVHFWVIKNKSPRGRLGFTHHAKIDKDGKARSNKAD